MNAFLQFRFCVRAASPTQAGSCLDSGHLKVSSQPGICLLVFEKATIPVKVREFACCFIEIMLSAF
jgi:hypothetical protein